MSYDPGFDVSSMSPQRFSPPQSGAECPLIRQHSMVVQASEKTFHLSFELSHHLSHYLRVSHKAFKEGGGIFAWICKFWAAAPYTLVPKFIWQYGAK